MAKVLIKAHVMHPDIFFEVVRAQPAISRNGGRGAVWNGVLVHETNVACICFDWESSESADRFWKSKEAKPVIAGWNAIEKPEISVLKESPED
jgi:hypothetical protein